METKLETLDEAADVAFRIRGIAYAAAALLDPISEDPTNLDDRFAARMATETIQDYASAIIATIERLARRPDAAWSSRKTSP